VPKDGHEPIPLLDRVTGSTSAVGRLPLRSRKACNGGTTSVSRRGLLKTWKPLWSRWRRLEGRA